RQHRFTPLTVPQIDDLRRLANLQYLERVRVIVDVGDRLTGDLDNDVAFLKTSLFGRSAADHAAQKQTFHLGRIIRDGAGKEADTGASSAAFRGLFDLGELRSLCGIADSADYRRREVDHAIEILVIDLVGGVGRTVVVGVRAGEEIQRRHI